MKSQLKKRLLRELRDDIGKYIALILFLVLTIGFVSGFLVADNSMKTAYDNSFEDYDIEDGHFILAEELQNSIKDKLEKEDVTVYEMFYKDVEIEKSHTIRLYKNREDINKICLMEGEMPEKDGEIIIDRLYAENNGIDIGDIITVEEHEFKVMGYAAFSDYSALFKNNTDMMFDANKFTVAVITDDDFEKINEDAIKYCYSWRNDERGLSEKKTDEKSDDIKEILMNTGVLTDFVKQSDNEAIMFTGEDMGGDKIMMMTLLYIVMAVLAFIFAVTARNTIEQESSVIGTLRALGYTKTELLKHYIALPMFITVISAIIGNIFGYTCMKYVVVNMYYHSYSLPSYKTLWNGEAFIYTTVVPVLIIFVVNLIVLAAALKLPPLKFLRHELTYRKKKKVIKLPELKFIVRFRLRIIFQNVPAYVTLFFGILFASVLLLFGLMMSPLLSYFRDEVKGSQIAQYQYILKTPVSVDNKDADKYCVLSLENENEEEITVYGIDKDSEYIDIDNFEDGCVYVSDGLMQKYRIDKGDKIKLEKKYEDNKYTFSIDGSYHYPATMAIFMTRDYFNEFFGYDKEYFNGYLSDEKLDELDDSVIASTITSNDLTVVADQLDDSMGSMFLMICGFAVLIYILVIYLLAKQIVEKNAQSISMIKILGYTDGEAAGLYNISTAIVVLVSMIISIPLSYIIIKIIYYAMMMEFNGWLTYYVAPWLYPVMLALGVLCYAAVHVIQMKKIRKIPMSNALKNIE